MDINIDVAQARRLADLINASVCRLEDKDTVDTKGQRGGGGLDGMHCDVQTIVSAATQLAALVRPPAQVLLEVATGFTLSAALRLVAEANVPEIIRALAEARPAVDDTGRSLNADDSGIGLLGREGAEEADAGVGVKVSDISRLCGVEVGKLERILRLLATHHIFVECPAICSGKGEGEEGEEGQGEARFANNKLSSALDSGVALEDILSSASPLSSPSLSSPAYPYAYDEMDTKRRWAAKYGAEAPGAGLAALVGILTDESMFHMTALTEVLLGTSRRTTSSPKPSNQGVGEARKVETHSNGEALQPDLEPDSNSNSASTSELDPDPDSPYHAPFSHARSLPRTTMFEWLGRPENAHRLHRFGCAMKGMNALESEGAILKGFDFTSLPPGSVIIDVGGGVGAASLPILRANEHLRLVVQDTEEVVRVASGFWEKHFPEALRSGRVKFEVQDFFEEQPHPQSYFSEPECNVDVNGVNTGGNPVYIYLLRMIAHNWGDSHCLRILKRLRDAAGPGSGAGKKKKKKNGETKLKLILVDSVLMPACRSRGRGRGRVRGMGDMGDMVGMEGMVDVEEERECPSPRKKRKIEYAEDGMGKNADMKTKTKMKMKMKMKIREAPEPLLPNWGIANALAYKLDLIMLSNHNALERTLPHFHSLLSSAGWEIVDVHTHSRDVSLGSEGGAGESWMPQIVAVPV